MRKLAGSLTDEELIFLMLSHRGWTLQSGHRLRQLGHWLSERQNIQWKTAYGHWVILADATDKELLRQVGKMVYQKTNYERAGKIIFRSASAECYWRELKVPDFAKGLVEEQARKRLPWLFAN